MAIQNIPISASLRFTDATNKSVGAYRNARTNLTQAQVDSFKSGISMIRQEPVADAFLTITTELAQG